MARLGSAQQRTSWTVQLPVAPTFYWSVQAVDGAWAGGPFAPEQSFVRTVGVANERPEVPAFAMKGANPVVGQAGFRLALPAPSRVKVSVYDVAGRRVGALADGELEAGYHTLSWGSGASAARPGVYLVRCTAGGQAFTRRVVILK